MSEANHSLIWLDVAASHGQEKVTSIAIRERKRILKQMPLNQIDATQQLAKEWKSKKNELIKNLYCSLHVLAHLFTITHRKFLLH